MRCLVLVGLLASVAAFSPSPRLALAPSQMLRPRPVPYHVDVQLSWQSSAIQTTKAASSPSWLATASAWLVAVPRVRVLAAAFITTAVAIIIAWLRRQRAAARQEPEKPEINPVWDFAATLGTIAGDLAKEAAASAVTTTADEEDEEEDGEPEPEPVKLEAATSVDAVQVHGPPIGLLLLLMQSTISMIRQPLSQEGPEASNQPPKASLSSQFDDLLKKAPTSAFVKQAPTNAATKSAPVGVHMLAICSVAAAVPSAALSSPGPSSCADVELPCNCDRLRPRMVPSGPRRSCSRVRRSQPSNSLPANKRV